MKTKHGLFNPKKIPIEINIEKFLSRIRVDKVTDCWEWQGALNCRGYGIFYHKSKEFRSHRISYSFFNGELQDDLVIDHICRNRKCVNPDHLRQVSMAINNTENSTTITAINKVKTHCKNGHELVGDNIRLYRGLRVCKKCDAQLKTRLREQIKQKLFGVEK